MEQPNNVATTPKTKKEVRDLRSRLLALLIGPYYLCFVASRVCESTKAPFGFVLGLVLLGAAVIMAVLLVFGVKAYEQKGPVRQFRLSSLMLLTIPLGIYLAGIRYVLDAMPGDPPHIIFWLIIGIVCVVFMVMSTIILLWLADALMWVALGVVRAIPFLGKPIATDGSDSESTN